MKSDVVWNHNKLVKLRKERFPDIHVAIANYYSISKKTISYVTWKKWEKGESEPKSSHLYWLSKLFNKNMEYFFEKD